MNISARTDYAIRALLTLAAAQAAGMQPVSAEALAAGITGARLEVIPGAGQQVNTDNPAAFNKAVYDFLASAPPRRSSASMGA